MTKLPKLYRVVSHIGDDVNACMFYNQVVREQFATVNVGTHVCEQLSDDEVVIAMLSGELDDDYHR